jgi:hypothetical protein
MCAVDISKTFDSINHDLLMEQVSFSTLIPDLVKWLAAYICNRSAKCVYGFATSIPMILRSGVLQGSVLSPALFNFFVSDCPAFTDILTSYNNDFTVLESDSDLATLDRKLQSSVTPITDWARDKKLSIAPAKSQVMLFTPWNKQYSTHLDVSIDDVDMPQCKTPKILGVTFNPMLCFHKHIQAIATKASQRLNSLKSVCSTIWGHDKETFLITYKALVELVFSYACAVWFPNCNPSNVEKLHFVQNTAICLITGGHKASSIDHLLAETKMMRLSEHLTMLCTLYLASCLGLSHLSRAVILPPPVPHVNKHG